LNKWSARYLHLAKEISLWSRDPSTKVGAIAVGAQGQILSQGYNGFPRGIKDHPRRLEDREEKYKYVVHGEMNCIYNSCLNGTSMAGSSVYVYGLPVCSECAKGLIQVGVSKVVMQHPVDIPDIWAERYQISAQMFREAGIPATRYDLEGNVI
jgi:dCMP deaminase